VTEKCFKVSNDRRVIPVRHIYDVDRDSSAG
jgi:hypothetical protein